MRTLRTYSSSGEALGDIAVLESQGIPSTFKGGIQGDAHHLILGTVELQVHEDDYDTAERLVATAEKDRVERYVAPEKKKKTPARYFRIALFAFIPFAALLAWKTPFLSMGVVGCFVFALLAGGLACMTGFCCALFDV